MLKEKQKQKRSDEALKSLVMRHIETGEPVSSSDIAEDKNIELSAATIRATMAQLDRAGFTRQPHSSAGRAPTGRGYRRYVGMLHERDFSQKDWSRKLGEYMEQSGRSEADTGSVLQRAASFVAETSDGVGVVVAPQFANDFIRSVRLIMVEPHRMLAVIVSEIGLIRSQTMAVDQKLSYFNLRRIEDYINARLGGKENLAQFGEGYFDDEELKIGEGFFQEIFLKYMIDSPSVGSGELFVEGFSNLLRQPDFKRREDGYQAIRFFEDKRRLLEIFRDDFTEEDLKILIGEEIDDGEETAGLAIVMAPYRMNSINIGVVGTVGPMRYRYHEVIPMVKQVGQWMSETFSSIYSKPRLGYDNDIPYKVIIG